MSLWLTLVQKVLGRKANKEVNRFFAAIKEPQKIQQELLFSLLKRNRNSEFGQEHHFSEINSIEEFRKRVPISEYDYFAPYIDKIKKGEKNILFSDQQVLMFALTSGTSSSRKFIPVTDESVDDYRRGWSLWGLGVFYHYPHLFPKPKITMVSDHEEFYSEGGIPCGSISGLTTQMQNPFFRMTYVLPPESGKIKQSDAKYYLAWRLGVSRDVGMWISPNPSTHVKLARFGTEHAQTLIKDLYEGTLTTEFEFPDVVRKAVRRKLKPNPKRAAELEQILEETGALRPRDIWPNLGMIGCWLGGSLQSYLQHFPDYFSDKTAIRDIGLVASENRMTIPKEDDTPGGVLDITTGYYEFIPVAEIDSDEPTVLEAHELEKEGEYYIIMTTPNGLYRYHICDVVKCIGFFEKTPEIAFLNKGSNISNLTGEKLSEYQVASSVSAALKHLELKLAGYGLIPDREGETAGYSLLVEESDLPNSELATQLADTVEEELRKSNIEYEAKRESGRLHPVRVELIPTGRWEDYNREMLKKRGGTAEQYKHPALITNPDVRSDLGLVEK
ncbi:GH3 auxin-responsive promoter [Polystyrenella longa]|uniref:GH3 auxin-responsive promoter n=1 Tax=Polystyrenella longa TaxID=2528007 RepID=A0A518CPT0_9PLAN|nr:GH3 auxin-responsive promoter family protein [Polystyrenella longa]QDU81204.1 GH3 auxin-responsive promoter [Polystyrenella longa]